MSAPLCPRRFCGERLEMRTDGEGRVLALCRGCRLNASGTCRDCPRRLAKPNALRCAGCSVARNRRKASENNARRYAAKRGEILAHMREYVQRPEVKARRRVQVREWAKRNRDGAQRLYSREYLRRWRQTPKGKANTRKAARLYRERHPEKVAERNRAYYAENRGLLCAKQRERHRQNRRKQMERSA